MTLPFAFRVLLAATLLVAAAEAGAACSSASDCQVAQPHCCAGRCVCDEGCSVENTADCTERGLCDDTNDIPRVCSGGDQDSVTPSLVCSPDCGPGGSSAGESCSSDRDCFFDGCTCRSPGTHPVSSFVCSPDCGPGGSKAGESCSSDGDCFFDGCTCRSPGTHPVPQPDLVAKDAVVRYVKLTLSLPLARKDFTKDRQTAFKKALADAAEVAEGDVSITDISEIAAERRSGTASINVAGSIKIEEEKADTVKDTLTLARINVELKVNGLPEATMVEEPFVSKEMPLPMALDCCVEDCEGLALQGMPLTPGIRTTYLHALWRVYV